MLAISTVTWGRVVALGGAHAHCQWLWTEVGGDGVDIHDYPLDFDYEDGFFVWEGTTDEQQKLVGEWRRAKISEVMAWLDWSTGGSP